MTFCSDTSLKNRIWRLRDRMPSPDAPEDVHPLAAEVAAARGVTDLATYFTPNFKATMPDPDTLAGMPEAVARIADAVVSGERIGIIGDYDVDGATSTAILLRTLAWIGHDNVSWRIPHRVLDGYGASVQLVDEMSAGSPLSVLVLLDNGTASVEPVAHARAKGIDVVIIDHHEPQGELPDAILVNPKREDGDRPLEHLCSAGLVFLFAAGLVRAMRARDRFAERPEPDLRTLLGLVALGTVADVVPLVGLNRAYVHLGLPRMAAILGLQALREVTGEQQYSAYACGFVFGPCINAAGRLEDMDIGVELLVTEDAGRAAELAARLHAINQERRKIQVAAVESAKERLIADPRLGPGIVLHDESWHPGIVGLVAGKVREAFDRPTIIIGSGGKGSARTVDGFDIGSVVIEAVRLGIATRGGGHQAAAGLTIEADKVAELRGLLEARMAGFEHPPTPVDLVVECGTLHPELVHGLSRMAPFGQGNPKPRIALTGGTVARTMILKGLHVKAFLEGPSGRTEVLCFNSVDTPMGEALVASEGRRVDILGTVETSAWLGVETAIVKPEDIMVGGASAVMAA